MYKMILVECIKAKPDGKNDVTWCRKIGDEYEIWNGFNDLKPPGPIPDGYIDKGRVLNTLWHRRMNCPCQSGGSVYDGVCWTIQDKLDKFLYFDTGVNQMIPYDQSTLFYTIDLFDHNFAVRQNGQLITVYAKRQWMSPERQRLDHELFGDTTDSDNKLAMSFPKFIRRKVKIEDFIREHKSIDKESFVKQIYSCSCEKLFITEGHYESNGKVIRDPNLQGLSILGLVLLDRKEVSHCDLISSSIIRFEIQDIVNRFIAILKIDGTVLNIATGNNGVYYLMETGAFAITFKDYCVVKQIHQFDGDLDKMLSGFVDIPKKYRKSLVQKWNFLR